MLVIPPDVCVHTTTYRTTVTFATPPGWIPTGLPALLSQSNHRQYYQPAGDGGYFWCDDFRKSLVECNSSPEFLQWGHRSIFVPMSLSSSTNRLSMRMEIVSSIGFVRSLQGYHY
ncbi:MAG: hypothetical protein R2795_23125 [Saprospiraceae bacterium]